MVVELEVPVQPMIGILQRVIAVGVHLLILNRSPQAFDEDVVMGAPMSDGRCNIATKASGRVAGRRRQQGEDPRAGSGPHAGPAPARAEHRGRAPDLRGGISYAHVIQTLQPLLSMVYGCK